MRDSNNVKLRRTKDSQTVYSDIPATDAEFWEDAAVVYPPKKVTVKLKIDEYIALWLKEMGNSSDTAINNLLRSYFISSKHLALK
ncbi:MAG: hypothetical protein PHV06_12105 [bacterium]|nr:hypothetical protein [bacterium]